VKKLTLGLICVGLSVVCAPTLNAEQGREATSYQKAQMVAEVQSMPGKQVDMVNAEGDPLPIRAALAREIPRTTYAGITGEATRYSLMSTYPDVELTNTSGKTVTSFMIVLHSQVEGGNHYVLTKNLSIASGGVFTFTSKGWLLPEKLTVQKDDGTFKSVMRKPGPDKAKFWVPGGASDLHVMVFSVVFEDGSQWRVPEDFDW
jgi:hypothetical protein